MAFIERACDFADDGDPTMPEGATMRIPPLHAYAALSDIANGSKTAAQAKAQGWAHGSPPMRSVADASGKSDQGDFDALVAVMPASPGDKALWLHDVLSTLTQGQAKLPGFTTPALIRASLGI
jgi:hypothetical protein